MKKKQTLFSIPSIKKTKNKKNTIKKNREKKKREKDVSIQVCPYFP